MSHILKYIIKSNHRSSPGICKESLDEVAKLLPNPVKLNMLITIELVHACVLPPRRDRRAPLPQTLGIACDEGCCHK